MKISEMRLQVTSYELQVIKKCVLCLKTYNKQLKTNLLTYQLTNLLTY